MLPRPARLTRRKDFTVAVRTGRRAGRGAVVVHLLSPAVPPASPDARSPVSPDRAPAVPPVSPEATSTGSPARVGFVVGRAVGGSVSRHRILRRLRHLVRDRLHRLPPGALMVVRAQPTARDADFDSLGRDLDAALDRLLRAPAGPPSPAGSPFEVGQRPASLEVSS